MLHFVWILLQVLLRCLLLEVCHQMIKKVCALAPLRKLIGAILKDLSEIIHRLLTVTHPALVQTLLVVLKQGQLPMRIVLLHEVAVEAGVTHRVNDLVSLFFGQEEVLLGKVYFVAEVLIEILLGLLEPCRGQALHPEACLGLVRGDRRRLPVLLVFDF